jgi:Ni,Fe-hydrogenase III large subunit/Ni,Fe-hydrogenase III component G
MNMIKRLIEKFGGGIVDIREPVKGKIYLTIPKTAVSKFADYIFNELKGRFVISVGTDTRSISDDYTVTYIFSLDKEKTFVSLKAGVKNDDLTIDSITANVPGANWAEREVRDMVGVYPKDHPDPRRLLLADDWPDDVYPLRKDFPYNKRLESVPGMNVPLKEPPGKTTVISLGPFFPVLEEPAHFRLFVEGEQVVGCDYRGSYNHRGIEKIGDSKLTYNQIPFLAERICGICGFIHSTCYCQAIEEAAEVEVPLRAKYIRTIMLELERIHSHPLWLGIAGHIIGFETVLMQAWRMREPIMWLCEAISGNRKTYGLNLVGGVRRDIPPELQSRILDVLGTFEKEWKALIRAIQGDTTLMMRLKNAGRLSGEAARNICVTGPTARGSGVAIDSRFDHPYAAYAEMGFKEVVSFPEGDTLARTLVRLEETLVSIDLIKRALQEMPEGPIMAEVGAEIPPGKEAVSVVEAPRGEAIHYVLTGPDNRPFRWRVRAPTYANLQAIPAMIQGASLADVPITIGSIDPCFSCTERMIIVDSKTGKERVMTQKELLEYSMKKKRR